MNLGSQFHTKKVRWKTLQSTFRITTLYCSLTYHVISVLGSKSRVLAFSDCFAENKLREIDHAELRPSP